MTTRTTPRQLPDRVKHDFASAAAILDQAMLAHVGFCDHSQPVAQPYVLPMTYVRVGQTLYLHGAAVSRLLNRLADGIEVCVTVTMLDGLVLSRSSFGHSMNYRSVMLFGRAEPVTDVFKKADILQRLVESLVPGRTADARAGDGKELNATLLLGLPITEFSVKQRSGPPQDAAKDVARDPSAPIWCGELPLRQQTLDPVIDPLLLEPGIDTPELPAYLRDYQRKV